MQKVEYVVPCLFILECFERFMSKVMYYCKIFFLGDEMSRKKILTILFIYFIHFYLFRHGSPINPNELLFRGHWPIKSKKMSYKFKTGVTFHLITKLLTINSCHDKLQVSLIN